MTTIYFSGGNSGGTVPEKLLGTKANIMPSFYYGILWTSKTEHYPDGSKKSGIRVDPKAEAGNRLRQIFKEKKDAGTVKAQRRKDKDRG